MILQDENDRLKDENDRLKEENDGLKEDQSARRNFLTSSLRQPPDNNRPTKEPTELERDLEAHAKNGLLSLQIQRLQAQINNTTA